MNDISGRLVFEARQLTKVFTKGGKTIEVLAGLELSLSRGEVVGILGASGAGKARCSILQEGWTGRPRAPSTMGEKISLDFPSQDLPPFETGASASFFRCTTFCLNSRALRTS